MAVRVCPSAPYFNYTLPNNREMNEYLIITTEGHKMYYKDADCSILHREDGPAIEFTQGHKSWYQDNLRHRDDGPAIEWGNETSYWLNGVEQEPLNLLGLR